MTSKKLHPSVEKFKLFVKKYPKITEEVRLGKYTWQELYEDWYLLGEEDNRWNEFKTENDTPIQNKEDENKTDFINQIFHYIKNIDINKMEQHLSHVSQAIGAVQGVLSQFQTPTSSNQQQPTKSTHPFSFRKD
jgi:hypothetical protein